MLEIVDAVDDAAAGVAELLSSGAGPAGVVLAGAIAWFNGAIEATTSVLRAAITPDDVAEWRCRLYCAIKANGGYSQGVLDAWHLDVYTNNGGNVGAPIWINTLNAYSNDLWQQQAYLGSQSSQTGQCDDCDCPVDCNPWSQTLVVPANSSTGAVSSQVVTATCGVHIEWTGDVQVSSNAAFRSDGPYITGNNWATHQPSVGDTRALQFRWGSGGWQYLYGPAYSSTHHYAFDLVNDSGADALLGLRFYDSTYGDNSGSFSIAATAGT